jgi:FAD/FMN-containing dehydrogenase
VELDGQAEAVACDLRALQHLLAARKPLFLAQAADDIGCDALWRMRRQFSDSLKATGLTKLNEDIVVPRGRLVELTQFAAMLRVKHGFPVACFGHAGDGNIHVNVMAANYHEDPSVRRRVQAALDELFAQVLAWGGVVTGEHGIGLAKKRWWKDATSAVSRDVHGAIKAALDPRGILNPGKFVRNARATSANAPRQPRARRPIR